MVGHVLECVVAFVAGYGVGHYGMDVLEWLKSKLP